MASIDTSLMLANYQAQKKGPKGDALGKDDFLKLLMTQLQNQDPSNPMNDTDFIAQMATFSILEQTANIASTLNSFMTMQGQNNLISYQQFVGKEISWHNIADHDGTAEIEEGTGKITSVQFKDGQVYFILDDGRKLEPGNISEIKEQSASSGLAGAGELIGKRVYYKDSKDQEMSAIVKAVQMKNGQTEFILDDQEGTKIRSGQIYKIEKQ